MTTIQSYDSRLALSAYQIGNAYTFYIQNPNMDHLVKIKASDYESHIQALTDAIEMNECLFKNNEQHLNFIRSIGVVVDKHESSALGDIGYITVMFQTTSNDYVIHKYAVNYNRTFI